MKKTRSPPDSSVGETKTSCRSRAERRRVSRWKLGSAVVVRKPRLAAREHHARRQFVIRPANGLQVHVVAEIQLRFRVPVRRPSHGLNLPTAGDAREREDARLRLRVDELLHLAHLLRRDAVNLPFLLHAQRLPQQQRDGQRAGAHRQREPAHQPQPLAPTPLVHERDEPCRKHGEAQRGTQRHRLGAFPAIGRRHVERVARDRKQRQPEQHAREHPHAHRTTWLLGLAVQKRERVADEEKTNRAVHRHPARRRKFIADHIGGEHLVNAEVGVEEILREREPANQGDERREHGCDEPFPTADIGRDVERERRAREEKAQRGVGLHVARWREERIERRHVQPPTRQHEAAHEQAKQAGPKRNAAGCGVAVHQIRGEATGNPSARKSGKAGRRAVAPRKGREGREGRKGKRPRNEKSAGELFSCSPLRPSRPLREAEVCCPSCPLTEVSGKTPAPSHTSPRSTPLANSPSPPPPPPRFHSRRRTRSACRDTAPARGTARPSPA